MRKLILQFVISIFGIAIAFAVIEVVYRLLPSHHAAVWNDRPKEYFRAEAATTMQDYPHEKTKPPGTYRIAVVGDSFTFAPYLQFDDAFPKRLERWLNLNSKQQRVEVINYGVPRYSTSHEVSVVETALAEGADLIVQQITLNDPEIKTDWPSTLMPDDTTGELPIDGTIFEYWKSLRFVMTRLKNRESQRLYREYYYRLFRQGPEWGQFQGSTKKIGQLCKKANVPLVAVIFPLFGLPVDDDYPFVPQHRKISKLLTAYEIPHLDLSEAYRGIPVERLQVLPGIDRHPNEIGHRIAAEGILKWFTDQKIIPEAIAPKAIESERLGVVPKSLRQPAP